jgi:hypothetical protein
MSAEVIKRLAALNLFLELRHLNIAPTTLLQRETIQVTWVRFSRMSQPFYPLLLLLKERVGFDSGLYLELPSQGIPDADVLTYFGQNIISSITQAEYFWQWCSDQNKSEYQRLEFQASAQ